MTTAATRMLSAPLQTRAAPISKTDGTDRTIHVIWTTGAMALSTNYASLGIDGICEETLLVTDEAVDLTRLKAGAAVLDSHQKGTIQAQRAIVEDAWLQSGKGYASVRFPKAGIDADSDRLLGLAKDGIIRNLSVGYTINRVRVVEPTKAGERPKVIVERWTPFELSFVTVPADVGAKVLTGNQRLFPVEVIRTGGKAGPIEVAATRLRMSLRANPRASDAAINAFATELRRAGIDPFGAAASRARVEALEAYRAEKAAQAKR